MIIIVTKSPMIVSRDAQRAEWPSKALELTVMPKRWAILCLQTRPYWVFLIIMFWNDFWNLNLSFLKVNFKTNFATQ